MNMPVQEESQPNEEVPGFIMVCSRLWLQTQSLAIAIKQGIEAIDKEWASHCKEAFPHFLRGTPSPADLLAETRENVHRQVVAYAESVFAPSGSVLSIDVSELPYSLAAKSRDEFDPVALWRVLATRYGGKAGATEAWRQAAERIRSDLFRTSRWATPPKAREKTMVLHQTMSADKKYSWSRPGISYSYNSLSSITALLHQGLIPFFAHEREQGAEGFDGGRLQGYATFINDNQQRFESRHKEETGRVTFIHFNDKIEIVMDIDTFQRLNLFLATYAPPAVESEAA